MERLQRELDKRSPAEPLVIKVYYADDWRDEHDEGTLAYEVVVDGKQPRVINMTWGDE